MADVQRLDFGLRNFAGIVDRDGHAVTVFADLDMDTCQFRALTWAAEHLETTRAPQQASDGVG